MQKSKLCSDIARRKKEKAKLRARFGLPSRSEMKKNFKTQMVQLAHDAAQIEDGENRTSILRCIQVTLEAVDEYDDWDELFEFVESNIDFVRMGVARGLYGLFDPRTQKIVEKAEERAMDRAMMADQRDT